MMSMHPDGDLFWKIGKGKGAMPGFKKILSDPDRWNLVNYIRTFTISNTSSKNNKHNHDNKDNHEQHKDNHKH